MQFKVGSPVTFKGQSATILSKDGFTAKLAINGRVAYELLSELKPVSFSKSDKQPATNVFGGVTTKATEAENFFRFPLDTRIEVKPTPDTAAEVDPPREL